MWGGITYFVDLVNTKRSPGPAGTTWKDSYRIFGRKRGQGAGADIFLRFEGFTNVDFAQDSFAKR